MGGMLGKPVNFPRHHGLLLALTSPCPNPKDVLAPRYACEGIVVTVEMATNFVSISVGNGALSVDGQKQLGIMSALHRINKQGLTSRGSVIFVHGLGGDPFVTWQGGADQSTFWPAWLAADLPEIVICTLEYDAAPTKWTGSAMALPDRAANILNMLVAEQCDEAPIVFICHSLGGLVVKQLLRIASDQIGSQFGRILERTEGVIFFATPNSGSEIASWADRLRSIILPTAATIDLRPDFAYLRDLDYWYRDHAPRENIATEVFVETQKTAGVTVVDLTSGDPGIPGVRPIPVDASHIDICKLKTRDDAIYKSVLRFIRDRILQDVLTHSATSPTGQSTLTIQDQIHRKPQSIADLRVLHQPGGVLRLDDPFYIERSCDGVVLPIADDLGITLVILASRQNGKEQLTFALF
jgi:pimeloyl-ACP methyl ester carboxylesterase